MINRLKNVNLIRGGVSFRWIISYLLVLLIPVLICLFAFVQSQNVLRQQVADVNFLLLKQTASQMENAVMDIQRVSSDVELNDNILDFVSFVSLAAEDDSAQQDRIRRIREDLASYTYTTENQLFLFLYLADTDMFITSQGLYDGEVFYQNYLDTEIPYGDWKAEFLGREDASFFQDRFVFDGQNCVDALGYSRSVPAMSLSSHRVMLGVLYDMTAYYDAVKETTFMEQGAVAVFDKNTGLLFANGAEQFDDTLKDALAEGYEAYPEKNGMETRGYNGQKVTVTYGTSANTGWKYVYFIPQKVFLAKTNATFYIIVFSMILIFLIGGAAIYILVKKNYAPLGHILSLLKIEDKGKKNEFELIKERIANTIEEKNVISTALDKQNLIVQRNYMARLLTGQINYKTNIAEILASLEIPFAPDDNYAVIMLSVESYDEFFEGETELSDYEKSELVDFMFGNVFGELIQQEGYAGFILPYSGNVFCIAGGKNLELTRLEAMVRHGQEFFDDNFSISFSGIISNVNPGYHGIYEGYRQTVEAGETRFLSQTQDLILYQDTPQSEPEEEVFLTLGLNTLLFEALIEKGDREGAIEYLTSEIRQKEEVLRTSAAAFRFYVFEITELLLNTCAAVCQKDTARDLQGKLLTALDSNKSRAEYRELFAGVIEQMCSALDSAGQGSNTVQRIVSYIEKNYADVSLNISTLAQALEMSDRYISTVFKKEKQMGLLDYIGMVRIEKAKLLLTETYMTIEDIYQKVGFTNKITFIRVFKKQEGITPTQYRNLRRDSNV